MHYKNLSDLPKKVKDHLDQIDQQIYLSAFNEAWLQYKEVKEFNKTARRKELADKMASNAVRRHHLKLYLKDTRH